MNLPNKLTMMRVIMVPFFMVFAAMSHMGTPQFNATYALIAGILFAVAGVRMIAAESGTVIAANMWGKVKTVLQMVTIIFYYFAMALAPADGVGVISFTTQVLCWAVAAVTALSGCIYLWQNRSCFMQAK